MSSRSPALRFKKKKKLHKNSKSIKSIFIKTADQNSRFHFISGLHQIMHSLEQSPESKCSFSASRHMDTLKTLLVATSNQLFFCNIVFFRFYFNKYVLFSFISKNRSLGQLQCYWRLDLGCGRGRDRDRHQDLCRGRRQDMWCLPL